MWFLFLYLSFLLSLTCYCLLGSVRSFGQNLDFYHNRRKWNWLTGWKPTKPRWELAVWCPVPLGATLTMLLCCSLLTVKLRFRMIVFGNSTCVLNSNPKWHWRVLPGGSLLVAECSSSSLGGGAAVCPNRLNTGSLLNFSSVHKHAELSYAYKRIDLRLMALRSRIIPNSLTQGTQGRDFLFLWTGSRTALIFPFMCKWKGKICPKLPGDYCLKAGTESATTFCVEVYGFWWWRIAPDAQSRILTSDDTIGNSFSEMKSNFLCMLLLWISLRPVLLLRFSVHQSESGFGVCQGDTTGWHKHHVCYSWRSILWRALTAVIILHPSSTHPSIHPSLWWSSAPAFTSQITTKPNIFPFYSAGGLRCRSTSKEAFSCFAAQLSSQEDTQP